MSSLWFYTCWKQSWAPHRQLEVSCSIPWSSWTLLCPCSVDTNSGHGPLQGGPAALDPAVWVSHHQLASPQLHSLDRRKTTSKCFILSSVTSTSSLLIRGAVAHLQFLQGSGSHVGVLEVDEGTETLLKNFDAFYFTKPVTIETKSPCVLLKVVYQPFH